MADREQLYQALRNADAAGDSAGAAKLAAYIQSLPAESTSGPSQPPVKKDATSGQIARALPAGVNRGMVNLAGLPVDTVANALDIGKAALGYGVSKFNGGRVPESLEINPDRSGVIGSSEWLANKIKQAGGGAAIDNPAPDSLTGRLLHTGGQFAGQAMVAPAQSLRQAGVNIAAALPAGAVTQGVTEATDDPLLGAAAGMLTPMAPRAMRSVGNAAAGKLDSTARSLMQSALKPTIADLRKGNVDPAIQTLLDNGINVSRGGVDNLRGRIGVLNDDISSRIADSSARVGRENVLAALADTRQRFTNQVSPTADLAAIGKVGDDFANHPYFAQVEAQGVPLLEALSTATMGKQQALQAAGKLQTLAAQQQNLAHGGGINLATAQPENQLYFNAGSLGGKALSPSAYPVAGLPRISGRYTHNIDRVPEGESGSRDAMAAYKQRRADEVAAQNAVAEWEAIRGSIPVQQAQAIKQGTYRELKNKYGQIGSAETEAQKSLARGLKNEIADAVPEIAGLNAQESALINALNVTERRVLMEANKNPMGLASIAAHPSGWAAFMADRSGLFKSLAARAAYGVARGIKPSGQGSPINETQQQNALMTLAPYLNQNALQQALSQ